jgi:hypothetical protein
MRRVIHIVRDGWDQAIFMMHQHWKGAQDQSSFYRLKLEERAKRGEFYRTRRVQLEGASGKTVEDGPVLLRGRYAEVKYEDLLERAVEEARHLIGFLGADTDEATVRRCVEAASFEALSGRERGGENYELNFRKHRKRIAGDWKNVFTERDKAVYKEAAGKLLITLGYTPDDDW